MGWNPNIPYGGYGPGYGYTGADDLGTIQVIWNSGVTYPTDDGEPGSISGRVMHDTRTGWAWFSYSPFDSWDGFAGWTVYLDQNENGLRDSDEVWTTTSADGSYSFSDLPTSSNFAVSKYYVTVDAPLGWTSSMHGGNVAEVELASGLDRTIYFAYYSKPSIGSVVVDGGQLSNAYETTIHAYNVSDLDGTVDLVAFYIDLDYDGEFDDLLGIDADGSDGFSIQSRINSDHPYAYDEVVYAVGLDNHGHLGIRGQRIDVVQHVDLSHGKKLVLKSFSGAAVTVGHTGPGTTRLQLDGDRIEFYDLGDTIEVVGDTAIGDIELIDTTGRSKLSIRATGGTASVQGELAGSTRMGVVSASGIDCNDGVLMTGNGVIRNLKVDEVESIVMPGESYRNGVKIAVDKIKHGDVVVGSPIDTLTAKNIVNTDIEAPSIKRLDVEKNFRGGSVVTTDDDANFSLGQLTVGNALANVDVLAAASIRLIKAGKMRGTGVVAGLGDGDGEVQAQAVGLASVDSGLHGNQGAIVKLDVGRFADSYVSAWRLVKVSMDQVSEGDGEGMYGLYYNRLVRYFGPSSLPRDDQQLVFG